MLYSRGYLARDACRMLSTSPPLSHAPSSALFAQPGPRELPLHGVTSPDSSPGLALHTVISSNSVRFEIICPHLSCSVLTNCSPNLWATQAAPCLWHIIAFCPFLTPLYPLAFSYWPVELNSPHPDQLDPQGPHDPEELALRAGFQPPSSPPCLVVPSPCSTATVPCHQLPFSTTATPLQPDRDTCSVRRWRVVALQQCHQYLHRHTSPRSHLNAFPLSSWLPSWALAQPSKSTSGLPAQTPVRHIANLKVWAASWQVMPHSRSAVLVAFSTLAWVFQLCTPSKYDTNLSWPEIQPAQLLPHPRGYPGDSCMTDGHSKEDLIPTTHVKQEAVYSFLAEALIFYKCCSSAPKAWLSWRWLVSSCRLILPSAKRCPAATSLLCSTPC